MDVYIQCVWVRASMHMEARGGYSVDFLGHSPIPLWQGLFLSLRLQPRLIWQSGTPWSPVSTFLGNRLQAHRIVGLLLRAETPDPVLMIMAQMLLTLEPSLVPGLAFTWAREI